MEGYDSAVKNATVFSNKTTRVYVELNSTPAKLCYRKLSKWRGSIGGEQKMHNSMQYIFFNVNATQRNLFSLLIFITVSSTAMKSRRLAFLRNL